VQLLSRDDLQGVIAHEFSHIVNGDMRLNIKLIGVLNGILLIGATGLGILRAVGRGSVGTRRDSKGGGAILLVLAIALILTVIGFIGVFFGRLIKAAVSRQREFLADAAAVQYTRNPGGLSGALRKIGGLTTHARINSTHAEEASHLFFGNALKVNFAMLSTHPPVEERIRAIDPAWDGKMAQLQSLEDFDIAYGAVTEVEEPRPVRAQPPPVKPVPFPIGAAPLAAVAAAEQMRMPTPQEVVNSVGRITPESIEFAGNLLAMIPPLLRERARHAMTAGTVLMALIIGDEEGQSRQRELDYLERATEPAVVRLVKENLTLLNKQDARIRLPLLDLSVPALR
jgi:hypothetical protein